MFIRDFKVISKLGDGTYSTVYKVVREQDNKTYALKKVKIQSLSQKQKQNALNQIRILASINHPNIINYKQAFVEESSLKALCIVMEFANNRDLAYRIQQKKQKSEAFTQSEIWNVFIQVVKGLNALHQLNIFHRDIKPANIILHEENGLNQAKLGDMNVSKISQKGLCMTQTGTPYYASPQVWKDKPYDSKSDIWSLGCVLYQMITLNPPFKAEDMEGLYKKVVRGIYARIPSRYSQDLSSMVRSLLQVNPQMRPSCQKILKMALIIKRMKNNGIDQQTEKFELLRTIRAGQSFSQLNENLPKANYCAVKPKKQKGYKPFLQQQTNQVNQIESLPILQKQKKIKPVQNSERLIQRQKHTINMLTKDRKKSEMAIDRHHRQENNGNSKSISHNAGQFKQQKDKWKLPIINNNANRYSKPKDKEKQKEKITKQNSLRTHKIE